MSALDKKPEEVQEVERNIAEKRDICYGAITKWRKEAQEKITLLQNVIAEKENEIASLKPNQSKPKNDESAITEREEADKEIPNEDESKLKSEILKINEEIKTSEDISSKQNKELEAAFWEYRMSRLMDSLREVHQYVQQMATEIPSVSNELLEKKKQCQEQIEQLEKPFNDDNRVKNIRHRIGILQNAIAKKRRTGTESEKSEQSLKNQREELVQLRKNKYPQIDESIRQLQSCADEKAAEEKLEKLKMEFKKFTPLGIIQFKETLDQGRDQNHDRDFYIIHYYADWIKPAMFTNQFTTSRNIRGLELGVIRALSSGTGSVTGADAKSVKISWSEYQDGFSGNPVRGKYGIFEAKWAHFNHLPTFSGSSTIVAPSILFLTLHGFIGYLVLAFVMWKLSGLLKKLVREHLKKSMKRNSVQRRATSKPVENAGGAMDLVQIDIASN